MRSVLFLAVIACTACGGTPKPQPQQSPLVETCLDSCNNEPPRSELLPSCQTRCEQQHVSALAPPPQPTSAVKVTVRATNSGYSVYLTSINGDELVGALSAPPTSAEVSRIANRIESLGPERPVTMTVIMLRQVGDSYVGAGLNADYRGLVQRLEANGHTVEKILATP